MAQKTDAQLQTQRAEIENETTTGANTAARVGQMFEDEIDSKINNDKIVDEDDMVSNSSTLLPTQQSVKAYVDANVGGGAVASVNGQTGVVVLDAGDIGNTPAGTIAATDVQAAITELDSDIQGHITDATAAHAATAIAFTPAGNLSATTVQAALEELDTEKVSPVGTQDLWVSAEAMKPQSTSGCGALTQVPFATSLIDLGVLPFDQTTQQFAQFQVVLPRKYNNSTVTVVPVWTATGGSGTVQWGISFGSYRNGDALTVALGTPQTSDDTLIATNDLHIGPATSAITPSGTIADGNLLVGRVSRNPASDTLTADALLIGIIVRVVVDAATDA